MRVQLHVVVLVLLWDGAGPLPAQGLRLDTLRDVQPGGRHEVFTFPHLAWPERPEIASRINRDLCVEFLEVDPDTAHNGLFTQVWGDPLSESMPRVNALTWSCVRPRLEVVSIELMGEFCSAYCAEFDIHYTYDLRSGLRLQYDSLFTDIGLRLVTDSLDQRWRRKLQDEVLKMEEQLTVAGPLSDTAGMIRGAIQLYTDCLAERRTLYVEDLELGADMMIVRVARCGHHADRALDELGAVGSGLDYSWLLSYFKPGLAHLFKK